MEVDQTKALAFLLFALLAGRPDAGRILNILEAEAGYSGVPVLLAFVQATRAMVEESGAVH
ncbi:hypothetical protein ACO2RV_04675 [Ancylobacter sp. VNQ12]|uniref:hypothetical protein n=1 Tax=Ancylobacter sp. VNQ12 TaxID=3400920 RepID=UPI003C0EDB0F